jgi:hypothetical protein
VSQRIYGGRGRGWEMLVGNIVISDKAYRCHMALLLDRSRERRKTRVIYILSIH